MSVALDILILLTAIWLPHYQPWVIIEGTHPKHGTIIRTGITCKKIPCYMRDSACRWFIVKKAKIF